MDTLIRWSISMLRVGLATLIVIGLTNIPTSGGQKPQALPEGYISGLVESSEGPEAGVWVIAETEELLTPFIKIVVTDEAGRFV